MEKQELQVRDIYSPAVDLAIHGQDNKLNLFSSFLFFQSILLLAWATVWQMGSVPGRRLILLAFSLFGGLSSIVWAILGSDYADAARQLSKSAADLEKYFPPDIARHPLTERENTLATKPRCLPSGRFLIALVTWGFVALYTALEVILWKSN